MCRKELNLFVDSNFRNLPPLSCLRGANSKTHTSRLHTIKQILAVMNCYIFSYFVSISHSVLLFRCCWRCPQLPGRTTSLCCRSLCWCLSSCWWTWRLTGQMWPCEPFAASWLVRRLASVLQISISFWKPTLPRPSTSPVPPESGPDLVSILVWWWSVGPW